MTEDASSNLSCKVKRTTTPLCERFIVIKLATSCFYKFTRAADLTGMYIAFCTLSRNVLPSAKSKPKVIQLLGEVANQLPKWRYGTLPSFRKFPISCSQRI
jgi:hypothetical protein